jgi:hypothetical protein
VFTIRVPRPGRPRKADKQANKKRQPIFGRRLMRLLEDQLAALANVPTHGNRKLCYDHVVVAHLLAFFNPTVDSLRTIEDVFEHPRIRKNYRVPRVPRSTLSDAHRLFEAALLQPIVDDLRQRLAVTPKDPRLDELTKEIIAVDATFFDVASRIVWALPHNTSSQRGSVQVCMHFDVLHGAPAGFRLVDGRTSERAELPAALQPNRLYLLDRAYQSYDHLNQIMALGSDFVVRLRRTANFTIQDVRPLTAADRLAGIQHDWVVTPTDRHYRLAAPVRLVEIFVVGQEEPVRLLTNRLDLPAEWIGMLYRHRWQIELFFRWLKCVLGLQRFVSESPEGMVLQLYVALIGTLLIALETGTRPTKYDYLQMSLAYQGEVDLQDALRVAARRRAERARDAARQKAYRARKKATR